MDFTRSHKPRGQLLRQEVFSVEDCRANPERLYVFGDNLQGWGRKGQTVIRDEPNAIGLPTKRYPGYETRAYLTNHDTDLILPHLARVFARLRAEIEQGRDVVLPERGLGTGLARLPSKAPRIFQMINVAIRKLQQISDGVETPVATIQQQQAAQERVEA